MATLEKRAPKAPPVQGPRPGLPLPWQGELTDVSTLSDAERKARGLAHTGSMHEICGDQDLLERAVRYCRKQGLCGFDLETTGLSYFSDRIVLVQFGTLEHQFLAWYDTLDMSPVDALWADPEVCKAGVNLKFDAQMWQRHRRVRGRNLADAQIVEQVLGCGLFFESPKVVAKMTSMASLARRWMGLDLDKAEEVRTEWGKLTPGQWRTREEDPSLAARRKHYAADDVVIPLRILETQKPWIREFSLVQTVNLEFDCLPLTADMELRGMKLDTENWIRLADQQKVRLAKAKQTLDELFEVEYEIHQHADGTVEVQREVDYASGAHLQNLIRAYMRRTHGVEVVASNRHFEELLRKNPKVATERLDKLFAPQMVPNPKKKGKRMKQGYPDMTDLVAKHWESYAPYLPPRAFPLLSTDTDTLLWMKIIYQTPEEELVDFGQVEWELLPTNVGLPPLLVDALLDYSGAAKNVSTYGYNWLERIDPVTGRLHVSFFQTALTTGRYSSSPNAQNFPRGEEWRACIVAENSPEVEDEAERRYIVGSDFSQIEPRIIAHLSQDPTYMRTFWSERPDTEGFKRWCGRGVPEVLDFYGELAKLARLVPDWYTRKHFKGDEATKEGKEGRQQAKVLGLMLGYGGGEDTFWLSVCRDTGRYWPKAHTDAIYARFFSNVEQLKKTLDRASDLCQPKDSKWKKASRRKVWHPFIGREVTYSETLGGRKRFYHPDYSGWWTQGRNMPVQGSGADILKRAGVCLTRDLWKREEELGEEIGGLINLIHDEYLAEIRGLGNAEWFRDRMDYWMQRVGEAYCPTVPVPGGGYVAGYWQKD